MISNSLSWQEPSTSKKDMPGGYQSSSLGRSISISISISKQAQAGPQVVTSVQTPCCQLKVTTPTHHTRGRSPAWARNLSLETHLGFTAW